jgi:hypothetical protein
MVSLVGIEPEGRGRRPKPERRRSPQRRTSSRAKANRKITAEGSDFDVAVFGHGRPITSDAGRKFRELWAQA